MTSPTAEQMADKFLRAGDTLYSLMHAGFRAGKEQFKNRVTVQVQFDREVPTDEREALIAALTTATANERRVRKLEAELAAVKERAAECGWQEPMTAYEPTGNELIDRLRGIITVPVSPADQAIMGGETFMRRFVVTPINLRAADALQAHARENERLREAIANIRDSVLHGRYQLADYDIDCDITNAVLGIIDDEVAALSQTEDKT